MIAELDALELLAAEAYDAGEVTQVIRPAAILGENAAHAVIMALGLRDVSAGGVWQSTPTMFRRYDRPWGTPGECAGESDVIGTIQVVYGTPTRHEITIYRATITSHGATLGWTVDSLCDEALSFAGYTLASCPRAKLAAPPQPFRFPG